ncbi:hypothetical protein MNV_590043 [Candidatus Methanoperedens nitroreducens]|uniref:Uncharacterized protein n=1 Tax=Candidatus Methanoperedens nitratireducens TaxID=1392998 RepID=A0A284VSC5_9EURY|nr:hypothetical protein MNV_590043 [Candidatus Methanoperedens nitroreducens]
MYIYLLPKYYNYDDNYHNNINGRILWLKPGMFKVIRDSNENITYMLFGNKKKLSYVVNYQTGLGMNAPAFLIMDTSMLILTLSIASKASSSHRLCFSITAEISFPAAWTFSSVLLIIITLLFFLMQ